jgi:hypothetical protein
VVMMLIDGHLALWDGRTPCIVEETLGLSTHGLWRPGTFSYNPNNLSKVTKQHPLGREVMFLGFLMCILKAKIILSCKGEK